MSVNAKRTLAKLRGADTDRGKVTLYLSREVYAQFKKVCGTIPASRVIDELLREFVESAQKKGESGAKR